MKELLALTPGEKRAIEEQERVLQMGYFSHRRDEQKVVVTFKDDGKFVEKQLEVPGLTWLPDSRRYMQS